MDKTDHFAYFGELTKAVHTIFIKDPRPYRKDIKAHVSDLIDCIKRNPSCDMEVSRPNYSEKISIRID